MNEICQKSLRFAPWLQPATRGLPGVQPLDMADWLQVDDAYRAQISERARLLRERRGAVLRISPEAAEPARELLRLVLENLPAGFKREGPRVTRPDGVQVDCTSETPLDSLCHLVSEDFCILQKRGDEHVLTAALLCFPASWSLAEKFGHPLSHIHGPVETYTDDIAARVQRMFDAVRPERPLWRANALHYSDPALFQPEREAEKRVVPEGEGYLRSERQSILRLPQTGAVVFSIHTTLVRMADLNSVQLAGLKDNPITHALKAPV